MGKELSLGRRFGNISLILSTPSILPVHFNKILLASFLKDILLYFLVFIAPVVGGFALGNIFTGINISYALAFLISFTLTFTFGLSIGLFLSSIYEKGGRRLILFIIFLVLFFILSVNFITKMNLVNILLPPLGFFLAFQEHHFQLTIYYLLFSLVIIALLAHISLQRIEPHFELGTKKVKNIFKGVEKKFRIFKEYSILISKDFVGVMRTEVWAGILFSFILPVILFWFFIPQLVSFISHLIPGFVFILNLPLLSFAILLSFFSISVYSILSYLDSPESYSSLPISIYKMIESRLLVHFLIGFPLSTIILFVVSLLTDVLANFFIAFIFLFVISFYLGVVIAYLTGLYPNALLANAKVYLQAAISTVPISLIIVILMILPGMAGITYSLFFLVFPFLIGLFLLRRIEIKWKEVL
jgi:hypothetical protein